MFPMNAELHRDNVTEPAALRIAVNAGPMLHELTRHRCSASRARPYYPNGYFTDRPCSTTFELMQLSTALSTQEMILLVVLDNTNLVRYSQPPSQHSMSRIRGTRACFTGRHTGIRGTNRHRPLHAGFRHTAGTLRPISCSTALTLTKR